MKIVIEIPDHVCEHAKNMSEDSNDEYEAMRAIAEGFPYEERPHGEWIKEGGIFYQLKCSNCNFELRSPDDKSNFCPNCGADMRKEGENK